MDYREQITDAIYAAIDAANATLKPAERVPRSAGAVLLGEAAAIESVVLVGILAAAEENLERIFGEPVEILDVVEQAEGRSFTVADLADWVHQRLHSRQRALDGASPAPIA